MLVLLGPDNSGKTTFANTVSERTRRTVSHHDMHTTYDAYLKTITELKTADSIMDRYIICEVPYSNVLNRPFQYTRKQFHNIILGTLSYNPFIILFTHKQKDYHDDVLPEEKWDDCLDIYRAFMNHNDIPFIEYDYANPGINTVSNILDTEKELSMKAHWREHMLAGDNFPIGSIQPDVLIVAERLGPNNMNNLPFETGPTGRMMTEMFDFTKFPLGKIAITNMVKAPRGDSRLPTNVDFALLELELHHLNPRGVLLMGSTARLAEKTVKKHDIRCMHLPHFGYYNHKGVKDMSTVYSEYGSALRQLSGRTSTGWSIR